MTSTKGQELQAPPIAPGLFYAKCSIGSGCWNWQQSTQSSGYGQLKINKVYYLAHRLSWAITNGTVPEGICVLHKCDNPRCVRPDHLFLGTHEDNMRDKSAKGRTNIPSGQRHWKAKLTAADIISMFAMKKAGMPQWQIAAIFGVHQTHVGNILLRRRWQSLIIPAELAL